MALDPSQPARPRVCYLEIPAANPGESAAFYERVFGWNIRNRNSERPRFDDASGYVSGAFVINLHPGQEPGVLVSIWVDDIYGVAADVAAYGGEVIEEPHPDCPGSQCLVVTFRDPAGNFLRLYEEPDAEISAHS
jgi:predicted enzyme related to lactoylglutathione lyase